MKITWTKTYINNWMSGIKKATTADLTPLFFFNFVNDNKITWLHIIYFPHVHMTLIHPFYYYFSIPSLLYIYFYSIHITFHPTLSLFVYFSKLITVHPFSLFPTAHHTRYRRPTQIYTSSFFHFGTSICIFSLTFHIYSVS